jgi:hypothetical protein
MSLEYQAKCSLLRVVDAYQTVQKTSDVALSKQIYGSSWFIGGLREAAAGTPTKPSGASFGLRKFDEMIEWFEDNWPVGAKWPKDVPHDRKLKLKKVFETRTRTSPNGEGQKAKGR